ncbi:potassium channel family protein [Thermodesulfobacteriota bacterium]
MNILRRLYLIILTIILVAMAGTYGYFFLFHGEYSLIDCFYMTVISLTSVGYGEVIEVTGNLSAQIFTMVLITFGMGIILYGISTLTALIIEGQLSGILRKKKMDKKIAKLNNHYIVCGGGEIGRPLLTELVKNKEQVVLIEIDQGKIDRCVSVIKDLLFIKGDATDDENLVAAGIDRATGIAINLNSDKETLYITMTARMLNKDIRIISRMIEQKLKAKLVKAGADSVVSPNLIGALRMASEMLRPAAVDFLDQMLRSSQGNLRIHDITVSQNSSFVGKKINASGLKDRFGLLVLGAKRKAAEITFNPPPSEVLEPGMTLVVMGEVEDIAKARDVF